MVAGATAGVFGWTGIAIFGALLVVGVAAIRWPGLIFAAYLLVPYYKGVVEPYLPVDLTATLAVMNSLQVIWIVRGGWKQLPRQAVVAWLALTIVVVAGAVHAPDWEAASPRAAQWLALILLPTAAAARIASDSRHIRHVVATIFGMGLLIIILAIPAIAGSERLVVLEQNTIQVATVVLFVPLIGMAFITAGSRLMDLALVVLAPLSLVVALATGSRGPPLAAACVALGALVVHAVTRRGLDRRVAAYLVASGAAGAIALVVVELPDVAIARFALVGDLGVRGELFETAIRLFLERPVFGHGTGAFAAVASATVGLTDLPYPHNIPLQVAAELGAVGLVATAAVLLGAGLRRLPSGPWWLALRFLFVFLFLESLVSGDVYTDRMLWGLVVLLLMAPSHAETALPAREVSRPAASA
jgi:O-antigen ligase